MENLTPATRKFILHWGEMGTRWGINRTVAQVHALLFLAPKPLNADDLVEALEVARSNISTSLRELQGWGIVKVVHVQGDRRDHFESLADVWELFQVIAQERKRREVDPTLALIRDCVAEARKGGAVEAHVVERLSQLQSFFETVNAWYDQVRCLPTVALVQFLKFGSKMRKLFGLG
jgi:DNA-binding transcriptional regulator GbsR (MarR family)